MKKILCDFGFRDILLRTNGFARSAILLEMFRFRHYPLLNLLLYQNFRPRWSKLESFKMRSNRHTFLEPENTEMIL